MLLSSIFTIKCKNQEQSSLDFANNCKLQTFKQSNFTLIIIGRRQKYTGRTVLYIFFKIATQYNGFYSFFKYSPNHKHEITSGIDIIFTFLNYSCPLRLHILLTDIYHILTYYQKDYSLISLSEVRSRLFLE